ncbi:MAG: ankyrin repeat domain-containing protein [Gammaproteobacteria bacterium]
MIRSASCAAILFVTIAIAGCAVGPQVGSGVRNNLDEAIQKDDLPKVRLILAASPDVVRDTGNIARWTPLHQVMIDGRNNAVVIVVLLLEHGTDPNARDSQQNTPLHLAGYRVGGRESLSSEVYLGVIVTLLKHKANVSARNYAGVTPLHLWTLRGADVAAVELLLVHGAEINSRATMQGWTPLHGAVSSGRVDLVEVLLQRGADVGAKDSAGRTPLQVAKQANRSDIADLLRQRGATD